MKVRCQLHPDGYIGTDKSDPSLKILNEYIESSSDVSEELFYLALLKALVSGVAGHFLNFLKFVSHASDNTTHSQHSC
jgi:hypothetical protein